MTGPREDGFTLVELLVAISILAIIVGVLGQAIFVGLKTTTATADTLVGAGDTHALESRLLTDVKGADAVGTTGGPPCAPAAPSPPAPTRVLWTQAEGATTGTKLVAAYFVTRFAADAGAGTSARSELSRISCTIDATGASAASPAQVLARWPGVDNVPAIQCDGALRSGGQATLETALGDQPADTTVVLHDLAGLPASLRYELVVDGETMTVTGTAVPSNSLTVTRTAPVAHAAGALATWGAGALAAPLAADGTSLTLTHIAGFPTTGPAYPITVDGETMTVTGGFGTSTLAVTRDAPATDPHPAGSAVTFAVCGAGGSFRGAPGATTLATAIDDQATSTTLTLNSPADFPTSGPDYPIVVGGETMKVTGGFGTDTLVVERAPTPTAHAAGTTITWGQTLLDASVDASQTTLALSDATAFPTAGPDYRIVVDGELMTVTGGFGTNALKVKRTSGVSHEKGAPVSWTPALATLTAPTVDAEGGPAPFSLSVARRAT